MKTQDYYLTTGTIAFFADLCKLIILLKGCSATTSNADYEQEKKNRDKNWELHAQIKPFRELIQLKQTATNGFHSIRRQCGIKPLSDNHNLMSR